MYLLATAIYLKSKYFVGWSMGDAAVIASGQAYNGLDKETKEPRFDRFYAIDICAVEFSVFSSAVTEGWNHCAHMWLKRYVYFRTNKLINRETALYLTYVISAFWHGFYPLYFAVFVLYAIITENHKDIHQMCLKYPVLRSKSALFFI